jgi:magnesium-transporting ATPase (P-type)
MYGQNMLVKSLQIIETFNSVSVIATDKVGTLTQNKITVTHLLWDTQGIYKVPIPEPVPKKTIFQAARRLSLQVIADVRKLSIDHTVQMEPMPSVINNNNNERNNATNEVPIQAFRDLLLSAALCNNAEEQLVQDAQIGQDISNIKSEFRLVGDVADTAPYNLYADRGSVNIMTVRRVNPRLKVLPFNSSNKFMICAHQLESTDPLALESDGTVLVMMKGERDVVIQRCSSYKTNENTILPLDDAMRRKLLNRQEGLGKKNWIELK